MSDKRSEGGQQVSRVAEFIKRTIQDSINPFTGKIDRLAQTVAQLVEALQAVQDQLTEINKKLDTLMRMMESQKPAAQPSEKQRQPAKRTAIEILKDQKVLFESEIADRIKNRDAYFAKLRREGAIILEGETERIAVDPDFWQEFLYVLDSVNTNNEDEIRKLLESRDKLMWRLFQALKKSALIYYDASKKRWLLIESEKSESSEEPE